MEHIKDRAERQVNRLTAHIRENIDFANLVRILGGLKWQVMEDVYNDLLNKRHLGDAENAQLNVLGKHLVTEREGRDDDEYTNLLDSRWNFYQQSGEPERLIELVITLTGATLVKYDDTYKLQCNSLSALFEDLPALEAVDIEKLESDLRKAKQGGQSLRIGLGLEPFFRFSADPDEPTLNSVHGFGSGKFIKIVVE